MGWALFREGTEIIILHGHCDLLLLQIGLMKAPNSYANNVKLPLSDEG